MIARFGDEGGLLARHGAILFDVVLTFDSQEAHVPGSDLWSPCLQLDDAKEPGS